MNYAEESGMDVDSWKREEFETFDFSYKDSVIANNLVFGLFTSEEDLQAGLKRLANVALETGSVAARASLAQYGGLDINEGRLFASVVNTDLSEIPLDDEMEVIRLARLKKEEGDFNRHLALYAVLGYTPERGDSLPCTDSPTADPYYDSKQTKFSSASAPVHEIHNSG